MPAYITARRRAGMAPSCRPHIVAAAAPAPQQLQGSQEPRDFLWRSSLSRRLNLDLAVEEACKDILEQAGCQEMLTVEALRLRAARLLVPSRGRRAWGRPPPPQLGAP